MITSSCKAKGRRFQQGVCAALLEVGKQHGLVADDIKSTSMGVSGLDVLLSPAAKRALGDLAIECKNVETLNVVGVFTKHAAKYPRGRRGDDDAVIAGAQLRGENAETLALLFHKRNRTEPMVTLLMADFMFLYAKALQCEGAV